MNNHPNIVRVSVLCVTRNRAKFLKRCLESVARQDSVDTEIVVVDNASEDETKQLIQDQFSSIKYIRLHKNFGFFPALNIAIANATGDYIFTIDDDAYFLSDKDIQNMLAVFDNPTVDVVTCNIEGPKEKPPELKNRYVRNFKTGFSLIRATVFQEKVGYYPDLFFRSAGEDYVATAVWDSGHKIVQTSAVTMFHDETLVGRSEGDWVYYGLRSQVLLVFMRNHFLMILPKLISKFFRGLYETARRKRSLRIWLSAWIGALIAIPEALNLRRPVQMKTERLLLALSKQKITNDEELRKLGLTPFT